MMNRIIYYIAFRPLQIQFSLIVIPLSILLGLSLHRDKGGKGEFFKG